MYRWLVGNLRLWSVTTNESSLQAKSGHVEAGNDLDVDILLSIF